MNLACVGLHEHFSDSGCRSEVAVDLKWRMSVEQISVHATSAVVWRTFYENWRQRSLQKSISMIAIQQSCPEIDFPGQTPACATVATHLQGLLCSSKQLWRFTRSDLIARIQGI